MSEEEEKVFRTAKLHSKLLVPWEIACNGKDAVIDWITNEQSSHRFKEGDEVAHKENLRLKMFVDEILKEKRSIGNGLDSEKKTITRTVNRMIGIAVHFFENAKA